MYKILGPIIAISTCVVLRLQKLAKALFAYQTSIFDNIMLPLHEAAIF
jgi:hypothetical protein